MVKTNNKAIRFYLRNCFRSCFIILSAVIFVLFSISLSFAEKVTFVKEYTYQASELDSKASCRTISLEMVKRLLLEELGTYLISETEVKDFKLTKEQVKTYSAGIVGAEIIEEKWDGKTFWLKARVSADLKEVAQSLKKIMEDKFKGKELEEMRKKAKDALDEIDKLKKEMEVLKKSTKKQEEYAKAVKELSATDWYEKGYVMLFGGGEIEFEIKFEEAIKAFDKALELDPNFLKAYIFRGQAYSMRGVMSSYKGIITDTDSYFKKALTDFDTVIKKDPNNADAYARRGGTYYEVENYKQAISDYNKAIALVSDERFRYFYYYKRGLVYYRLGNYKQAIKDYQQAIKLAYKDYYFLYIDIGRAYGTLNNHTEAIRNYNKAIELKPDFAMAYYNRGIAYHKLGNYQGSIKDFQIAARLGNEPAQDFLRKKGISW